MQLEMLCYRSRNLKCGNSLKSSYSYVYHHFDIRYTGILFPGYSYGFHLVVSLNNLLSLMSLTV
jgi:hypothetical protein